MATGWQTFPIEASGGLITNISPIQQGLKAPGSARKLTNFEPSIKGGYRRINGYNKYDDEVLPTYGDVRVQGSGQTGTSLVVSNLFVEPADNSTLMISGVTGTYTVTNVSYSATNKEATLTLDTSLDSSPADKATVTFIGTSPTDGIFYFNGEVVALRDSFLWTSNGFGWTNIGTITHGTVLVDGASQTGSTLAVDGLDSTPKIGDTFTIDGVEKVYTVLSEPTVTSGSATISIYPSLDSSPADDASITFIGNELTTDSHSRFVEFNFDGTPRMIMVSSDNYPIVYDGTSTTYIDDSTDIEGATHVEQFKEHLFYAKDDVVYFSGPFQINDLSAANGGGNFFLPYPVTGLAVFRDQLIIFTEQSIHKLVGASLIDFTLTTITEDIGCVVEDTIQEVSGDIVFLGPDGIRSLGATQRIGDFNLAVVSRNIQDNMTRFTSGYPHYCSLVVREKSQYRIFGYQPNMLSENAVGYLATQFEAQNPNSFAWSKLEGIKANVAHSSYDGQDEIIVFSGEDGYVYRQESGSTFDGDNITAYYFTPYLSITDPVKRKTIYTTTSWINAEGLAEGNLNLSFDLGRNTTISPPTQNFSNSGGSFAIFGEGLYGTAVFGNLPDSKVRNLSQGSFNNVSLQYEFSPQGVQPVAPFIIDFIILEFKENGRK